MSTERVIVTARCHRRGHVLAELIADGAGVRVRVPRHAVATVRKGRAVNGRSVALSEPLDRSMSYTALCPCGAAPVSAAHLADAMDARREVIVVALAPV